MTQNLATIADSLYASFQQEHDAYLKDYNKWQMRRGTADDPHRFSRLSVPDQRNTNDCGVFACLCQLLFLRGPGYYNTKYHIEV